MKKYGNLKGVMACPVTSLHDLVYKVETFNIGDQPHVYKVNKLNEFLDCTLQYETKDGFETIGYISPQKKNRLKVVLSKGGLQYTAVINLTHIKPIKTKTFPVSC